MMQTMQAQAQAAQAQAMDYDYITQQAENSQKFKDGESVKVETPAQKLRTSAWGLNTKCSKPNCVLPEREKKKAQQISCVVIAFCEDSSTEILKTGKSGPRSS